MLCNGGGAPILAVCRGGLRLASSIEAVQKRVCGGRWADLNSPRYGRVRADPRTQARIARSSGPTPMIAIRAHGLGRRRSRNRVYRRRDRSGRSPRGLDQFSGPVVSVSCSTAAMMRRQISAPA
jgi:hypothetical protein